MSQGHPLEELIGQVNALRGQLEEQVDRLRTQVDERLELQLGRLKSQVDTIESLTRENLPGFHLIFQKAMALLRGSRRQFWMLSFTPAFGLVHTYDKSQLKTYWEKNIESSKVPNYSVAHDRFLSEVNSFREELRAKARTVTDFRLATVDASHFTKQFRDSVIEKMGNDLYDPSVDAQAGPSQEGIQKAEHLLLTNHKNDLKRIHEACHEWSQTEEAKDGPTRDDLPERVTLMTRIPLQMIISDAQTHSCVVFFIGDFNVRFERRVTGFHTAQAPLVTLFEDIFRSNVEYFKKKAQGSKGPGATER